MNPEEIVSDKVIINLQMSKSVRYTIASAVLLLVTCLLLLLLVKGDESGEAYNNSFWEVTFTKYFLSATGCVSLILCCIAIYNCLHILKSIWTFVHIVFILFPLIILSALLFYAGLVFMLLV